MKKLLAGLISVSVLLSIFAVAVAPGISKKAAAGVCIGPTCPNLSPETTLGPNSPTGWIDAASCTTVSGWASDFDNLAIPIAVHIYIDGLIAGDTLADIFRSDVGSHGWVFNIPPARVNDNLTRSVNAYGIDINGNGAIPVILATGVPVGNNPLLSGSPATIGPCTKTCANGSVIAIAGVCTKTCPDGSVIAETSVCPPTTKVCPDGSTIPIASVCPPTTKVCPDGSTIPIASVCPPLPILCQNGTRVALPAVCPNTAPIGIFDTCTLVGTTTHIKGWAYDADSVVGADPTVSLKISQIGGPTINSGNIPTDVEWRTAAINPYIGAIWGLSTRINNPYGFDWAVPTALFKGGGWLISGVVNDFGPGAGAAQALTYPNADITSPDYQAPPNFFFSVIDDMCLSPPPPPAPKVGCMDSNANNFDPSATVSNVSLCTYAPVICTDGPHPAPYTCPVISNPFVPPVPITAGSFKDIFTDACKNAEGVATVCGDRNVLQSASCNSIFGTCGIIGKAINLISILIGVAAVVMTIVGGLKYVASAGDPGALKGGPSQVAAAKRTVTFAIIGVAISILAQGIIRLVFNRL